MKLNRTPNPLDRNARNGENENWDIIEGEVRALGDRVDNFVDEISEDTYNKLVEDARLDWREMVDEYSDLPTNARKGTTVGVKEQGIIYRYNGSTWDRLFEINLNPIAEVDDRLTSQLNETDDKIFFDSLVNKKKNRRMILWIDDDSHVGVYTKIKPLIEEYNIPMTVAVITDRPFNSPYLTKQQIEELRLIGVEFVSHAHTHDINHRLSDMSEEELHQEFSTSKRIIKENGWNDSVVVYPFGSTNALVRDVARQYFEAGFDVHKGVVKDPMDQFNIPRISADSPRTLSDLKGYIDEAKQTDESIVFMTHVDQYGGLDMQKTRETIEYAHANGYEFVTVGEFLKHRGNLAQFDEVTISNKGKIYSETLSLVEFAKIGDYENNAAMTVFPINQITKLKVRTADRGDYGVPQAGTIDVHRYNEDVYSYQEYISNNRLYHLLRTWSGGNWSEWMPLKTDIVANPGVYNANLPISAFTPDVITRIRVRNDQATGYELPNNLGGIVEVHRFTDDEYSYQKFVSHHEVKTVLYRKWSVISDKWLPWYESKGID